MMYARSTAQSLTSRAIQYSGAHASRILRLQDQISSGVRISRAADDPFAYQRISAIESQLAGIRASESVIHDANSRLNFSVGQLQEVHSLIASANRLSQQGAQALGPAERSALAVEAEGLLRQARELANTKLGEHFLYGGTRSDSPPFAFDAPTVAGRLISSTYQGGRQSAQSVISSSLQVDSLYRGDTIFDVRNRQPTILTSFTGTAVAAGTDSMTGRAILQVRHTGTTYAGSSGVTAAASSPGRDTILGGSGTHQLTIVDTSGTGASGTVALDGGEPVPFDSSMTELRVTGSDGEMVFIDTTAITAGFNGTVDIATTGTLSVDGGATTVAIDYSASQTITDSITGKRVRIDTSNVVRTGDDHLEFAGTTDLFETLDALIQDLRGNRPLDGKALGDSLGRISARLDELGDQVLSAIGNQSSSLLGLEQILYRNEDLRLQLETEQTSLQSTDLASAIIELQQTQLMQQATFTVTSQIMSQSLLNFFQ